MKILVLNAGSSSQKLRLYEVAEEGQPPSTPPKPLWLADAEWGQDASRVTFLLSAGGKEERSEHEAGKPQDILEQLLTTLWQGKQAVIQQPAEIAVVGHRVVHGGQHYPESVLLTPQVQQDLHQLIPFAPLHEPANLEGMSVIERLFPGVQGEA